MANLVTTTTLCLILAFTSRTRTANESVVSSEKQFFQLPLDPGGEIKLLWDVDYDRETVVMQILAQMQADEWTAIGFSDYGDIENSDLCVLWVDKEGKPHFTDTWSDSDSILHVNERQNCHLVYLTRNDERTNFTFHRKFDTCDDHDYVIDEGTTHVVYVTGRGPLASLEGLKLRDADDSGFQHVQLLKNTNPPPNLPEDVKTIAMLNDKVQVPNVETTYWCSLHKLPPLPKKQHIVQFEAVVQSGHEDLIHHMEVFHCEIPANEHFTDYYNGPCSAHIKPHKLESCQKVLATWAMGEVTNILASHGASSTQPLTYPEEAGAPIGGPDYSPYVMLEVHYNNEEKKSDIIDSSGIIIRYTPTLRKYDIGVMELGLEYTPKMAIPPRQSRFTLSGHCIPECTRVGIPSTGIMVFASQLHTHLSGKKVVTRHIRREKELPLLVGDEHYSPHFQIIRMLKKPVHVLPVKSLGDGLITSCTYGTSDRENITLGGFTLHDEMCVNYIHYYPKINLEVCKSSVNTKELNEYFQYMKEHEHQKTSSSDDISTNYRSIDWTQLRSQSLRDLYKKSSISMQCNQSDGTRFPGNWTQKPQAQVLQPFAREPRKCSNKD